jgi:hypothetical protein
MSKDPRSLIAQKQWAELVVSMVDPTKHLTILKSRDVGGEEIPFLMPEALEPVVCSQAALARFEIRNEHTTDLAQQLKDEGILRAFIPPKRKGGKYQFWFTDLARHKNALAAISKKPGRRTK